MAYFRCGGAGIPASIKTDMNAVLNKKFGTSSQNYPPTEWAADVNLLGKLPEKTASGAIAHFEDGADEVPLKSSKFYITPNQAAGTPSPSNPLPISGHTGLTITRSGANFYNSGVEMGNISANGDNTDNLNPNRARTINKIPIEAGKTYTVGQKENYQVGLFFYKSDGTFLSFVTWGATPRTFTTPTNTAFIRFAYQTATNALPTELQLEEGSTLETYEAPTTYSVSWSEQGTVYGGYFKDGELTNIIKVIDNAKNLGWTATNTAGVFYATISDKKAGYDNYVMSPQYKYYSGYFSGMGNYQLASNSTYSYVYIKNTDCSTVDELKTALDGVPFYYVTNNPTTLTIEPVEITSLLGVNNIWCDTGDSEVEYRADIDLLLAALGGGNRSLNLMQAPSISEQEETEEEKEAENNER